MADEALIRCVSCRDVLTRQHEQAHPDGSAHLEFYACNGCGRKLALFWEMTGQGASPETQSWVEREVAIRGAFFPNDIRPSRHLR